MTDRKIATPEANAVAAWMSHVLAEKGWTPNHWARVAGTSPTNITRFLKDRQHVPGTATLAKLGRVAGSQPPLVGASRVAVSRGFPVNVHDWKAVAKEDRGTVLKTITTTLAISEGAFGVVVRDAGLDLQGIQPGDTLIVEPARILPPKDGSVVVCVREGDEPVIGRLHGKMIVFHSSVNRAPEELGSGWEVAAVGVEVRRGLAGL